MVRLALFFLLVLNGPRLSVQVIPTGYANWIFRNVPTPLRVVGEGLDYQNLVIRTYPDQQVYHPDSTGVFWIKTDRSFLDVRVFQEADSLLFEQHWSVKSHPKPHAYLRGTSLLSDLTLSKGEFLQSAGIVIELLNYDIEAVFQLASYDLLVVRGKEVVLDRTYDHPEFSDELRQFFKEKIQPGDRIFFTNIKVKSDYWEHEVLNSITIVIK